MDDLFNTPGNVDSSLFENAAEEHSTDGAENEANSAQSTSDDGQQQSEQEQAPNKQDTPTLYAGKYESLEAFEKAYSEAQKLLTKQAQELAAYKSPQQQQDTSNKQQNLDIDWYAAFQADPINTMAYMAQMVADQKISEMQSQFTPISQEYKFQKELNEVQSKYPDFQQHTDGIVKILEEMPEIGNLPNKLDVAYRIAKGNALAEQAKTAYQSGQQDALKLDAQKAGKIFDNKSNKSEAQISPEEQMLKDILGAGGKWRSFGI